VPLHWRKKGCGGGGGVREGGEAWILGAKICSLRHAKPNAPGFEDDKRLGKLEKSAMDIGDQR